jgi:hypothetical protein
MVVLVVVAMAPFRANQESTIPVELEPMGRATEVATHAIGLRVVVVVVPAERAKPRRTVVVEEPAFRVPSLGFPLNTPLAVRLESARPKALPALLRVRVVAVQGALAMTAWMAARA